MAPHLPGDPVAFALYFYRQYWLWIVGLVVFEVGQAASQILIPQAVKEIVDIGMKQSSGWQSALVALTPALQMFVAYSLGILFFSRASGTLLVFLGPLLRKNVRQSLFHYLQFHSHRYFISHFAGSLSNRISEVSMGVAASLWTVLFDFLPVAITFSVSIALLASANSQLAMVLGGWVVLYVLVSYLLAIRCQVYAKNYAATRSMVSGKIVDGVTNMLNSKLFARMDFERIYLTRHIDTEVLAARKTFFFMEGMRWFQFVATMVLQVAMVLLAVRLWIDAKMTTGEFTMAVSLVLLIINDARGLSRRFLEFFEYLGNISDGVSMIVQSHEVLDKPSSVLKKVSKGEIVFEAVGFKYGEGITVFENLNLTIPAGERVGLVGFSGSGKTTFVNLILRMYDLTNGRILIDGEDIANVKQDDLRSQISMIPQEPMLFHRSLMENIRYGRIEASDEDVILAARAARAHEFIVKIPEQYSALVGERGVKLSGGQRQRIAIARAVLKNAPILILDEATSSLDSITEKSIQSALTELMKDRTVVVVAHRLSTIAHLNRILVFDHGRIVEDGTHDQLLAQNGQYAKLWSMQAGGFLPDQISELSH